MALPIKNEKEEIIGFKPIVDRVDKDGGITQSISRYYVELDSLAFSSEKICRAYAVDFFGELEEDIFPVGGGIESVIKERKYQVIRKGFDWLHDDQYENDELIRGALAYLTPADERDIDKETGAPKDFPWKPKWWKSSPDDRIKDLIKAASLIISDIDRRVRKSRKL